MKPFTGGKLRVRVGKKDIREHIPNHPLKNLVSSALNRRTARIFDVDGSELWLSDVMAEEAISVSLPTSLLHLIASAGAPATAPFTFTIDFPPLPPRAAPFFCALAE